MSIRLVACYILFIQRAVTVIVYDFFYLRIVYFSDKKCTVISIQVPTVVMNIVFTNLF